MPVKEIMAQILPINIEPLLINRNIDDSSNSTFKFIDLQQLDEKIKETSKEYVEVVYKESAIREIAFLNIPIDICGVEVKQLTPYLFILLDFIKSPFLVNDRMPDEINIVDFLWIISTRFVENDKDKKAEFIKDIAVKLKYDEAIKGIYEYLNEAFIDSPAQHVETNNKLKKTNIPFYAWIAGYIDILSSEYGWLDNYIMNMPFTRIFQYLKTIEARKMAELGKEPLLFNQYSDKVMTTLRKLNREKLSYKNSVEEIRQQLIKEEKEHSVIWQN